MSTSTAPDSRPRRGTQSLERGVLLLRELATRGAAGWGLRDLALHCGLDRATVHRLLQGLARERLVQQRETDRRYVLGPLSFELGVSTPHHHVFAEAARSATRRLARNLGVVSLAYLRSGDDLVCIARAGSSSYSSEATGIRVGHRAPLLSLSGGIAMLAALPPHEARSIIARNRARLVHLGTSHLARAEALVRNSARIGHVLSAGVVWQRIHSIGMSFGPPGAPIGSLIVSSGVAEYPGESLRSLLPQLEAAAIQLSRACPPAG